MPRYAHNVVCHQSDNPVIWNLEPRSFPGSADAFAMATLVAWLHAHQELADKYVTVNVWDSDQPGAGDPSNIIAQLSNDELDEGPFDPNQIYVDYGHYHVLSAGYNLFDDDPVLGYGGTDYGRGTLYGLIVPGAGPGLRIRAGHTGWITLNVARYAAEPSTDLTQWEASEQVVVTPAGEVRIADQMGELESHYPDLAGGGTVEYLAIRVSVRGRGAPEPMPGPTHPRRTPLEEHLIEAWPATGPAGHAVLKRDVFSRNWESGSRKHQDG
jgi:hypothetical protein